jgi:hypothetical protein
VRAVGLAEKFVRSRWGIAHRKGAKGLLPATVGSPPPVGGPPSCEDGSRNACEDRKVAAGSVKGARVL